MSHIKTIVMKFGGISVADSSAPERQLDFLTDIRGLLNV